MQLHLVRHGESAWNAQGRLQGQAMAVPLTELGRRQAAALAEQVAALGRVGTVLSSDQARAWQTAVMIGERLGIRPRATPLLRERALGELTGLQVAEPDPRRPDAEGEPFAELVARAGSVQQLVAEVAGSAEDEAGDGGAEDCGAGNGGAEDCGAGDCGAGDIVVVTHGTFLAVLLAVLDDQPLEQMRWPARIPHAQLLTRRLSRDPRDRGARR
jgi:broad specificity phosphatase PhoE